ncbi:hypothetical protein PV328_003479 [Microctonus aethiopoides]|uniref:Uncharacterized protein n=1 Tax=Microctonus aethiopoides TaxID=144406 RepID=A0AA39F8I3_9HYME|nr:hypothetical protein PV328_003479 [Microctonus aethiopoides]
MHYRVCASLHCEQIKQRWILYKFHEDYPMNSVGALFYETYTTPTYSPQTNDELRAYGGLCIFDSELLYENNNKTHAFDLQDKVNGFQRDREMHKATTTGRYTPHGAILFRTVLDLVRIHTPNKDWNNESGKMTSNSLEFSKQSEMKNPQEPD